MKEFKRLNVQSTDLNRVQDNVEEVLRSLRTPLSDSLLLTDIALNSGDNTIAHKLNRVLQGWIVVSRSSSAVIYDKQSTNTLKNRFLILNASSAVVVSLIVF